MNRPLSRTLQLELQLTHVPSAFSGVLQAIEELAGKKFPEGEGVEKELYVHRLQSKKERAKELRDKHSQIKKERLTKYQVGNNPHQQACQAVGKRRTDACSLHITSTVWRHDPVSQ